MPQGGTLNRQRRGKTSPLRSRPEKGKGRGKAPPPPRPAFLKVQGSRVGDNPQTRLLQDSLALEDLGRKTATALG